jgi:uncharacterized protein (DUF488 family)
LWEWSRKLGFLDKIFSKLFANRLQLPCKHGEINNEEPDEHTMNASDPSTPILYTIGHSNIQVDELFDLLGRYKIQSIVDVRSHPYSQFSPQFNREPFEQKTVAAGLHYYYAGEFLGGRPKDPTCYKNGVLPEAHADFLHLVNYPKVMTMDFFQKGILRLTELINCQTTVVMCSEENPAACHRHHLIGKYLVQQNVTVLHIRGDGNIIKDQHLPNVSSELPAVQLELF